MSSEPSDPQFHAFGAAVTLSGLAGYVDAVGYLSLANVFTSHMSGNSVALGAYLSQGHWIEAAKRLMPIPFFVLGVGIGAAASDIAEAKNFKSPHVWPFLLEMMLLTVVGICGGRFTLSQYGDPLNNLGFVLAIAAISLAMGMQNATLRRVSSNSVRTTFVSGTLTDFTEAAVRILLTGLTTIEESGERRHADLFRVKLYGSVFIAFLGGALLGGLLQSGLQLRALLPASVVLAAVTAIDLNASMRISKFAH